MGPLNHPSKLVFAFLQKHEGEGETSNAWQTSALANKLSPCTSKWCFYIHLMHFLMSSSLCCEIKKGTAILIWKETNTNGSWRFMPAGKKQVVCLKVNQCRNWNVPVSISSLYHRLAQHQKTNRTVEVGTVCLVLPSEQLPWFQLQTTPASIDSPHNTRKETLH